MNLVALRRKWQYADILSKIQKIIPSTIIAGGAVRDLCHNKPVNDIDIYAPSGLALGKAASDEIYSSDFWKYLFPITSKGDYVEEAGEGSYAGNNHIDSVFEICSNGILYNVILVDIIPIEYVEKYFNIGLCKAYFDGKKFRLTADFMRDSKNLTFTLLSEDMKQAEFNSMFKRHVAKLQRKYPNYSVVVPPAYTEMYHNFIKQTIR